MKFHPETGWSSWSSACHAGEGVLMMYASTSPTFSSSWGRPPGPPRSGTCGPRPGIRWRSRRQLGHHPGVAADTGEVAPALHVQVRSLAGAGRAHGQVDLLRLSARPGSKPSWTLKMGTRNPLACPSDPLVGKRLWGITRSFSCHLAFQFCDQTIRSFIAHLHGDVGVHVCEAALPARPSPCWRSVDAVDDASARAPRSAACRWGRRARRGTRASRSPRRGVMRSSRSKSSITACLA